MIIVVICGLFHVKLHTSVQLCGGGGNGQPVSGCVVGLVSSRMQEAINDGVFIRERDQNT